VMRPLRFAAPKLYEQLISVMEDFHMHPYDIDATASETDDKLHIQIRYGESYTNMETFRIDPDDAQCAGDQSKEFFQTVMKQCRKQWIADYYKMMKP